MNKNKQKRKKQENKKKRSVILLFIFNKKYKKFFLIFKHSKNEPFEEIKIFSLFKQQFRKTSKSVPNLLFLFRLKKKKRYKTGQ